MENILLNDDILLNVKKPARYIGLEHNVIKKPWVRDKVKICLCYPDLYELGMSHLGLKILYHVLNKREDVICERCFTPWHDMESQMRQRGIALFSLENRVPLRHFDIIGFSLQYELTYTNILNMLHLAGVPLHARDRGEKDPLIIAGGPSAFNPEPLADFIDMFLIGDGEEAVEDIVDTYHRHVGNIPVSRQEIEIDRGDILQKMSAIEGVYVPASYDVTYSGDEIVALTARSDQIPTKIRKRVYSKLKEEAFPVCPLVPYIETTHDRISIEIMRGCLYKCRFCQARSIYGPARIRSADEIIDLAERSYKKTGFDTVSLLSLSSASYPGIEQLLKDMTNKFLGLGVGISFPSLRIEKGLKNIPSLVSLIKKSGLTFAPEAGTQKMLRVINKDIDLDQLIEALKAAYQSGWQRVKLYFMIGLPFEDEDDLAAIAELAEKAGMLRKEYSKHPADIIMNISYFIPKPHTTFQWSGMDNMASLQKKHDFLRDKIRGKRFLKLKMHNMHMSTLEAVLSRGDRRLSSVIYNAWDLGARFDAWDESFNYRIWQDAFAKSGLGQGYYLKEKDIHSVLPWSHIDCGISSQSLAQEYISVSHP